MELSYFAIIIGAIFVNNVVLAQFLGSVPSWACRRKSRLRWAWEPP